MTEKKILYTVEIEGNEALLSELARLRKETADLKNENQNYNKALKAGEKVSKEQARNFERNTIQIKQNNASIRNLTRELQGANKEKDNARKRLTDMRRALQEMALAGDTSSEAYRTLRGEAAELQDAIDRVNQEVKVFADDAMIINTVVDATRGLTAGFQGVLGVQALLGFESEKFRETMQKLVAVQQVSNALQTVSNLLQKESRLVILGKVAAVKIATAAQWAWNAAMTANPIGLIITAVAALGAGVYALVKHFDSVSNAIRRAADWLVFWKDLGGAAKDAADEMETAADIADRMNRNIGRLRTESARTVADLEHQIRLMQIIGSSEVDIQKERVKVSKEREAALKKESEELNKAIDDTYAIIAANEGVEESVSGWDKTFRDGFERIRESNKILTEKQEKLLELFEKEKDLAETQRRANQATIEEQKKLAVLIDEIRTKSIKDGELLVREERKNALRRRIIAEDLLDDKLKLLKKEKEDSIRIARETSEEIIKELETQREEFLKGLTPEEWLEDLRLAYADRIARLVEQRENEYITEEEYNERLTQLRNDRLTDEREFQKQIESIDSSLEFLTTRNDTELLIIEEFNQKRLDLIEEHNNREQELRNQFLDDVREQFTDSFTERIKLLDDYLKKRLISEEEYNKLLEEINQQEYERQLEAEKIFQETRGNIIDRGYQRERELLREKLRENLITNEEYYERLKSLESEYEGEKKLEEIREWYNQQETLLKEHLENKILTQQQYDMLVAELEQRKKEKENEIELQEFEEERNRYIEHLQLLRGGEEAEYDIRREQYKQWLNDKIISQEEYNERIKALDKDLAEFRKNVATAQAQAMLTSYRSMSQGLSQLMANQDKESKFFKAMAIADATIALVLGLARTWEVGFPQAIPMAIGYVAQTAGLINQITQTKQPSPPKLEKGGIIGGKPHSQGGTKFYGEDGTTVEAERGEYITVINKKDAERARYLDEINSLHGKSFLDEKTKRSDINYEENIVGISSRVVERERYNQLINEINQKSLQNEQNNIYSLIDEINRIKFSKESYKDSKSDTKINSLLENMIIHTKTDEKTVKIKDNAVDTFINIIESKINNERFGETSIKTSEKDKINNIKTVDNINKTKLVDKINDINTSKSSETSSENESRIVDSETIKKSEEIKRRREDNFVNSLNELMTQSTETKSTKEDIKQEKSRIVDNETIRKSEEIKREEDKINITQENWLENSLLIDKISEISLKDLSSETSTLSTEEPKKKKYAKGGMIGGKPHSQGGTVFRGTDGSIFEAERGEYLAIVNKRDAERAQMLDEINQEHGKSFGITKFSDGGIYHTTIKQFQSGGVFEPRQEFERIDLSDVIREAVDEISQIPVVVAERDISTTQERIRRVEVKGNL